QIAARFLRQACGEPLELRQSSASPPAGWRSGVIFERLSTSTHGPDAARSAVSPGTPAVVMLSTGSPNLSLDSASLTLTNANLPKRSNAWQMRCEIAISTCGFVVVSHNVDIQSANRCLTYKERG